MISQQELEFAIKRWKARQAGADFADSEATADGLPAVAPAYDEPQMTEYDVDDDMAVESETAAGHQGGVPQFVPSLSDSSLIELDPDVGDPDHRM